jgi:hypothetical protein
VVDNSALIAALRGQDAMPFGVGGPAEPAIESGAPGLISALLGMPKELMEASAKAVPGLRRQDVTDIPGSTQPNDPMYGAAADMAMNLASSGMPAAEKGAAGIFGGKLAKTADLKALQEAEQMRMGGKHPDDIWKDTGWAHSPMDSHWKFEIPDNKLALKYMPDVEGNRAIGHVDTLLSHPELKKAYPQLFDNPLDITRAAKKEGWYYPVDPVIKDFVKPKIVINAPNMADARSVASHELQHGVQDLEGFTFGSNKSQFAKILEEDMKKAGFKGYDFDKIKNKSEDFYHRTAGEVEPRNVQKRLDFSPTARRILPPWATQDVPYDKQLVIEALKNLK